MTLSGCKYLCLFLHNHTCTIVIFVPNARSCILLPWHNITLINKSRDCEMVQMHHRQRKIGKKTIFAFIHLYYYMINVQRCKECTSFMTLKLTACCKSFKAGVCRCNAKGEWGIFLLHRVCQLHDTTKLYLFLGHLQLLFLPVHHPFHCTFETTGNCAFGPSSDDGEDWQRIEAGADNSVDRFDHTTLSGRQWSTWCANSMNY